MTPRSRCRSLGGSGLRSRFQRLPPAQLCLCPQAEETTAFPQHNRNKVPIKIAGTRSASFYFFQAVLGLSSSSRPSFFASIVPQMFSKVAWDCVRRQAHFLTPDQSHWKQFSEILHPVPFFWRQSDRNTTILFITSSSPVATGYEGATNIGFFAVTCFPPAKSWVKVFLLGLCPGFGQFQQLGRKLTSSQPKAGQQRLLYTKKTFHTLEIPNLAPSIMYHKNEVKYLKLILRNQGFIFRICEHL